MTTLVGCEITAVAPDACGQIVSWLAGASRVPSPRPAVRWVLVHCDDGVVWGRLDGNSVWQLSSARYPDLSPPISPENLQQARLFGPDEEILMWRTAQGLRGRLLTDRQVSEGAPRPADDKRVLLGANLPASSLDGFTLLSDEAGSAHVVPVECRKESLPLYLQVRHYFERDAESGAVRVGASRLVKIAEKGELR